MHVSITYCAMSDYRTAAVSLAVAIKDALGIDSDLVSGSDGVFDVVVNGQTVFSRQETGRLPGHDEILERLDALGAP